MPGEDDRQTRLRVGGWLPAPDATGRVSGSGLPEHSTTDIVLSPLRHRPELASHARRASRRRMTLAGVTVGLALAVLGISAAQRGGVAPATVDSGAVVGVPGGVVEWPTGAPTTKPGPPAVAGQGTSPSGAASPTGGGKPTAPARTGRGGSAVVPVAPSTAAPTTPGVSLRGGTRVGLEPVTHPGYRVRHRDFAGRIDRIGAGSGALDKADATFTVRAGLASSGCVSFESVNYPGYYLRHQNFQIYLHRRDGAALFAADATFCAVAGLTGQRTSLRSYNYPQRYLHHRDGRLGISAVDGGATTRAAMTFIVRAPL